MGQWERLHSATFTFCQAFCSTAMPFILNLHVFMSEAPTIHSSLACDLIHTQKKKSHKRWWQSLMHDTEASKTNTERYFLFHGLAIFVIPSCSPRLLDRKTSIFLSLFDLLQFIQFYKLCSQNVPWRPLAESVWLLGRSLCHKEAKRMNKSKKFQKMHWNGKRSLILAFHQPGSHLGPGMWMHRKLNDSTTRKWSFLLMFFTFHERFWSFPWL